MRIALLIPTYNEAINIELLLKSLASTIATIPQVQFDIFVIDDSSPDGTAQVALELNRQLKTDRFQIQVINRAKKEGLGKAYINGFKTILSLDQPQDFVMQMDADLSHSPKYLPQFIDAIKQGADFIVGSRYIPGGSAPNWGLHRKIASRGGNFYSQLMLGKRITDYTGGFNLYSIELLKRLDMQSIEQDGYGFLIGLKFKASVHSKKIIEVPIQFMDREYGNSKMPISTIFKSFLFVTKMRLSYMLDQFKHKK